MLRHDKLVAAAGALNPSSTSTWKSENTQKVLHFYLPGGGLQQVVGGHGHELNLLEDHLLPLLLLVER